MHNQTQDVMLSKKLRGNCFEDGLEEMTGYGESDCSGGLQLLHHAEATLDFDALGSCLASGRGRNVIQVLASDQLCFGPPSASSCQAIPPKGRR